MDKIWIKRNARSKNEGGTCKERNREEAKREEEVKEQRRKGRRDDNGIQEVGKRKEHVKRGSVNK